MKYWDSSAVVALIARESRSARLLALAGEGITTWWATEIECASALTRTERELRDPVASAAQWRRLSQFARGWTVIEPSLELKAVALRNLRLHPLRAADALQLAAAVIAGGNRPATLDFVCLDARLRQAAEKEGFPVLPV